MSAPGGWLDPSVPDLRALLDGDDVRVAIRRDRDIDTDALAQWLAPRLAKYRAYREIFDIDRAPRAKHIDAIARLEKALGAAFAALDGDEISDTGEAELDEAAHSMKRELWREVAARLRADLTVARLCAGKARDALQAVPAQPGRPSAARRDALLAELVDWLKAEAALPLGRACELAAMVLTRCGVQCPVDSREVEKIMREKPG